MDYSTLHTQLLASFRAPAHLPSPHPSPASGSRFSVPTPKPAPSLTSAISALRLHPALEAALHLLNHDLASAHFLLRKMQSPPAHEAMYLHAILHKLEGDLENARAWYRDVAGSDVEKYVQGAGAQGRRGSGEAVVDGGGRKWAGAAREEAWEEGLGLRDVRVELERVVEWCAGKWGCGVWEDASKEYVRPAEKIRGLMQGMVSGADGPRMWAETGTAGVAK